MSCIKRVMVFSSVFYGCFFCLSCFGQCDICTGFAHSCGMCATCPCNVAEPTITSTIAKSGYENNVISFASSDFTGCFSSGCGGLAEVQILSLPASGELALFDGATNTSTVVATNQEIALANLNSLIYTPNAGYIGNDTFVWNGNDGYTYATNANSDVNLAINDQPPTLAEIAKTGCRNAVLSFTSNDFTSHFSGYQGNPLDKIQIVSLPTHGTLEISGLAVTAAQEIPAANLGNLTYTPDTDYTGSDSFTWNGSDGYLYATSVSNVALTVDVSAVSGFNKSIYGSGVINFEQSDFTTNHSDPCGYSLTKVKISSLPAHGTLNLSNVAVTLDQEILSANLGNLVYVPNTGYIGNDGFTWNGYSGYSYAGSNASVTIVVNNPLVLSDVSKVGHSIIPFIASDFVNSFFSHAGSSLAKIRIISLPSNGLLELSGTEVNVNQEVLIENISNLVYRGNSGYLGADSFTWAGSDGTFYAIGSANVITTVQNKTPIVNQLISKQQTRAGELFGFAVPSDVFSDPDGDQLVFSAYLSSYASLPGWLNFDKASRTFSGTPTMDGVTNLKVVAKDPFGAEAQTDFVLEILKSSSDGDGGDYCNNNPGVCYVLPPVVTVAIAAAGGAFGLYKYMHESKKVTTASVPMTSPALP